MKIKVDVPANIWAEVNLMLKPKYEEMVRSGKINRNKVSATQYTRRITEKWIRTDLSLRTRHEIDE